MSRTLNTVKGKSRDHKYKKFLQENGYGNTPVSRNKIISKKVTPSSMSDNEKMLITQLANMYKI